MNTQQIADEIDALHGVVTAALALSRRAAQHRGTLLKIRRYTHHAAWRNRQGPSTFFGPKFGTWKELADALNRLDKLGADLVLTYNLLFSAGVPVDLWITGRWNHLRNWRVFERTELAKDFDRHHPPKEVSVGS